MLAAATASGCSTDGSSAASQTDTSTVGESPASTSPASAGSDIPVTEPDWDDLSTGQIDPPGPSTGALSTRPIRWASLAMADPNDFTQIYVLGDDGEWRLLDTPLLRRVGDGANESSILRATSLSSDGTRLALPQPDALLVVNLTTDQSMSYEVPGPTNVYAAWEDESHVFIGEENRQTGSVVNLDTSAVRPTRHGPATRVLTNGSALTWAKGTDRASQAPPSLPMRWDDGRVIPSHVNNQAPWLPTPPLAQGQVAVSVHRQWGSTLVMPESTGDPGLDELLYTTNGVAAVDSGTGQLLGFLPLGANLGEYTTLLGWRGDLPVLGLVNTDTNAAPPDQPLPTHLVVWDYSAGTLETLGELPSPWVAWGVGL